MRVPVRDEEGMKERGGTEARDTHVLESHDMLMSGTAVIKLGFELHVDGLLFGRGQGG